MPTAEKIYSSRIVRVYKLFNVSPRNNLELFYPQIFIEADLDEDNQLSFAEFEHVISKAPDFVEYVE